MHAASRSVYSGPTNEVGRRRKQNSRKGAVLFMSYILAPSCLAVAVAGAVDVAVVVVLSRA